MHVYMMLDTDKCVLRELFCVCFVLDPIDLFHSNQ